MFSKPFYKKFLFALSLLGGASTASAATLEGNVKIDGSSTVFPIAEAVAEEYGKKEKNVRVTVGVSGTGGGFKKFLTEKNNTDINNASRPIKEKEIKKAASLGIDVIELPIAFDGITVVVSQNNDFVDHLTVEELNKIFAPGSDVKLWSDIRASWPQKEIALYGPGTDSGTFDYFTEVINGKSGKSRDDYTASEDDNVLVKGVGSDEYALGYFGYAYYVANKKTVKAVPIVDKGAKEPVAPTQETINKGLYTPLSRPIFIYVNAKSLDRPEVKDFTLFLLDQAGMLAEQVGYIALPGAVYDLGKEFVNKKKTGAPFAGIKSAGQDLIKIMKGA